MPARPLVPALALLGALLAGAPPTLAAQTPERPFDPTADSVLFARAQRLVGSGEGTAGRALIDSVLASTSPGTPRYGEALYWRALLAATAAEAERDYKRVSVEYPLSPRADEALLRLAQLELARGDRAGAEQHLARLLREHPTGSVAGRANAMVARARFDQGDVAGGCAALAAARANLDAQEVEQRNQLDYYAPRCAGRAAAVADSESRAPTSAAPSARGAESPSRAATSTAAREFSVQVAAFQKKADADALAKRLTSRGYSARVVGGSAPYRVRVGRYATRAEADAARTRMRNAKIEGIVVEAESR